MGQQQTEVQTSSSVSPMQVSAVAAPALPTHGLRAESPLLLTNDHFLRPLLPQDVLDGLPAERAAIRPPCICTSSGRPRPPRSLPGSQPPLRPLAKCPLRSCSPQPSGEL